MNPCLRGMTSLSCLAVVLGAVDVHGHGAHEHGVAMLDIGVEEDGVIQLELSTPAANLIGFEHAPRDKRQRRILADAVAALEQGDRLFTPDADAHCTFRGARILSALLHDEGDDGHGHADDHGDEHGDHADVFVAWRFDCAAAASLRNIDAGGFFERFPGTERVRVQAVTARGQSAMVSTGSSPQIRLQASQ